MAVDGPGPLSVEVEVGVVRQVHDGRCVRRRLERQADLRVRHVVGHPGGQVARETLVPVRALQPEDRAIGRVLDHLPQPAVEAVGSAVQVVATVVRAKPDLPAVEGERAAGDPVRVAADAAPEVVRGRQVVRGRRVAEDDVASHAVTAGDLEPVHGGPEVQDLQDRPRSVPEHQAVNGAPVLQLAERGQHGHRVHASENARIRPPDGLAAPARRWLRVPPPILKVDERMVMSGSVIRPALLPVLEMSSHEPIGKARSR